MTDPTLRRARRLSSLSPLDSARHWQEELRAGRVIALPCPECGGHGLVSPGMEGGCPRCEGHGLLCPRCQGHCRLHPRESVVLAAYVGDPGAREMVSGDPKTGWTPWRFSPQEGRPEDSYQWHMHDGMSLDRWARGLSRWGLEPLVRAGVATSRVALPVWENNEGFVISPRGDGTYAARCADWVLESLGEDTAIPYTGPDGFGFDTYPRVLGPRRAIEAAEAWLACPCREHREACRRAAEHVDDGLWYLLLHSVFGQGDPRRISTIEVITTAAELATEAKVREAIRESLVAWLVREGRRG